MFNMTDFAAMPVPGAMRPVTAEPPLRNRKHSDRTKSNRKHGNRKRQPPKAENWNITRTRHELRVDWNEVKASSRMQNKIGFEQIIVLCQATGRGEFIVENIAPDYKVGDGDPAIVMEAQERIVRVFNQVSKAHFSESPEYRLSLRNGAFDLRFYLGRTHPTYDWAPDLDD